MHSIIGASVTYRLAFGPTAGRKALTLQAVPTSDNRAKSSELVDKQAGFSLHAGVACKSNQRKKLERLWLGAPADISRVLPSLNTGPPSNCHWPVTAT